MKEDCHQSSQNICSVEILNAAKISMDRCAATCMTVQYLSYVRYYRYRTGVFNSYAFTKPYLRIQVCFN